MHKVGCIRSDGAWICVPSCTHDTDEARANEHAAACAVADAWVAQQRHNDKCVGISPGLSRELDCLEEVTRPSALRKVRP